MELGTTIIINFVHGSNKITDIKTSSDKTAMFQVCTYVTRYFSDNMLVGTEMCLYMSFKITLGHAPGEFSLANWTSTIA